MSKLVSIDPRDVFYLVSGLAFFGLIVLPRLRRLPFLVAPPVYLAAGAALALSPFALHLPNPLAGGLELKAIEHATELIVIVSLTERGENAGLTMMAATFACYGLAEMVSAYGFLAVFVSAVAGRSYARGHATRDPCVKRPHQFSEQFESLLLALLLLWFGGLAASGLMAGLRTSEVVLELALVLVPRPAFGMLACARLDASRVERLALSFYGIRGLGRIFYLAYGASHADFRAMDAAWRVASVAIVGSIVVHGVSASVVMGRIAKHDVGRVRGTRRGVRRR